jgi:hypothetical protein
MASCNAGNLAKSKLYYAKLGPSVTRTNLTQMCVRAGISISQLDSNDDGFLDVNTKPSDAKVLIDGVEVGKAPLKGLPVSPGKHKVTFVIGLGDRYTYPLVIEAGKTTRLIKDLR